MTISETMLVLIAASQLFGVFYQVILAAVRERRAARIPPKPRGPLLEPPSILLADGRPWRPVEPEWVDRIGNRYDKP